MVNNIYNTYDKPVSTPLEVVERMVVLELDEDSLEVAEKQTCVVCISEFRAGENIKITPCKHVFHEECLAPWLKMSNLCPHCRFTFN